MQCEIFVSKYFMKYIFGMNFKVNFFMKHLWFYSTPLLTVRTEISNPPPRTELTYNPSLTLYFLKEITNVNSYCPCFLSCSFTDFAGIYLWNWRNWRIIVKLEEYIIKAQFFFFEKLYRTSHMFTVWWNTRKKNLIVYPDFQIY